MNPNPYQLGILGALQGGAKHVYAGTVSATTVAKRRARNKAARRARRANRKG